MLVQLRRAGAPRHTIRRTQRRVSRNFTSSIKHAISHAPSRTNLLEDMVKSGKAAIQSAGNKGRGLFATKLITAEEEIACADPIVAASRYPSGITAHCYMCFRPLVHSQFVISQEVKKKYGDELASIKKDIIAAYRIMRFEADKVVSHPQNPDLKFCGNECFDRFNDVEVPLSTEQQKQVDTIGQQSGSFHEQAVFRLMARFIARECKHSGLIDDVINNHYFQELEIFPHDQKQYVLLKEIYIEKSGNRGFSQELYTLLKAAIRFNAVGISMTPAVICMDAPNEQLEVSVSPNQEQQVPIIGLYPASIMNHSCDPNVGIRSPMQTARIAWISLRDIEPGEEIFCNYVDTELPVADRRIRLKATYNFFCNCPKCIAEDALDRALSKQ